jgi:transposase
MRFVKLTDVELKTLQEGHKNHTQFQFRNRCQCLMLSHQGMTVSQLAKLFEISEITVYSWFDRWEKKGLSALMNQPGRGRKAILSLQNSDHIKSVKTAIQKNPQSVKAIVAELETALHTEMSTDTVKRFLKNLVSVSAVSERASSRGSWVLTEPPKKRR